MNIKLSDAKILIVEDDTDFADTLKIFLECLTPNVFTVDDGCKCIEFVKNNRPDLVLLDIVLPEMNGLDVCKNLKMNKHTKDIPVIFMTSLDNNRNIIKGLKSGAVDYLIKPFESEELVERSRKQYKF